MENSMLLLALAGLVAFAFISKKICDRKPKKKLPPGPKPWPIIGNLHQIGTLPHISLHEFAQKYGEIMKLKYGQKTVVVASSPKMAEEFLKKHDLVFASRPPLASGKWTAYNYQDVLWSPYGPHWQMARKIYSNELFSPKRLDSFEHIRVDERRNFFSGLYAGNPLVLREHITRYTLSSITRVVLSNEYFSNSENNTSFFTFGEFHDMLDEWLVLNGVLNIGDWIPFLSFFDLQGYVKRMKILNEKFEIFYNFVIGDHKARMEAAGKNFVPKDMVDVLLSLTREDNIDPEIELRVDAVKALVNDLMLGGTDSSSITTEWALHELFQHPHIMKKAREEIDKVIGREKWVEEDDYPNLPYIDAIIKETMRLHPLSPLLPPHYSLEDCNVAGYDIPKGTIVLINAWSIQRSPDYWDEPLEFKPERFLQGKEIGMLGQNFSLLPFGSGRRKCPGYSLALKLVRTTLSNLLHGFHWEFPDGFTPEDLCMVERYGLTTCPEVPVTVIPVPRLPSHLYQ